MDFYKVSTCQNDRFCGMMAHAENRCSHMTREKKLVFSQTNQSVHSVAHITRNDGNVKSVFYSYKIEGYG